MAKKSKREETFAEAFKILRGWGYDPEKLLEMARKHGGRHTHLTGRVDLCYYNPSATRMRPSIHELTLPSVGPSNRMSASLRRMLHDRGKAGSAAPVDLTRTL